MPATAEGLGSDIRLVKVALKHDRATHQDFSGCAHGDIPIRFIHESDLAQGRHFTGTARMVYGALQRHKTTRLSLTKAGPELRRGLRVEPGNRVRSLQAGDVLEARERAAYLCRSIQELGEDRRKTGHIGDTVSIDKLYGLARIKTRHHDIHAAGVHGCQSGAQGSNVK